MPTMHIDEAFRALIPPLSCNESAQLEQDIAAFGCRDALVVWAETGILLDGHHRAEICEHHDLPYKTVELSFPDADAAKEWVIRNQFGRRNLVPFVRAELALKLKALVAARSRQGQRTDLSQNSVKSEPLDTQKVLAAAAGVSHDTIAKTEELLEDADAETLEQLREGAISVNKAHTDHRRKARAAKRAAKVAENVAAVASAPDPLAAGAKFTTLLLDPPWDWGDEGDVNQMGRARPDYATMPMADLKLLPIPDLSADDAHLYLWITNRSLPKGFDLLAAWGFRYVTMLTWPKPHFGMGNYFRGQTEHLLFGVRGSLPLLRKDAPTLLPSWPRGPNGHSSKPVESYGFIESCSPGPYLELFARSHRAGWTAWGEPQ